ncbi:electron transport complex subunit RsxC [Vibrio sp. JC009]|uniref:electron transport complex subunit RsxC n=1 Tax=Vibrio sp. JC009 TaxID=2912314 RepID=UPI0023B18D00|nr:electron transport complex subunit RsxC [Vibrio sp. JC009]WED20906.1 electron transport complex subunit RsxC [Vibrio sp. JC009]
MPSLIEQIRHGSLWDFHGGIHPPENKEQSTRSKTVKAGIPDELILPLKQHIGRPGDLQVKVGDKVKKGQELTRFTASFMLPVHAPTSGTITAIEPRVVTHPSGLKEPCIVLKPDGEDLWLDDIEKAEPREFRSCSPDELIEIIRHAGVAGMGGAGFPTARKIQSGVGVADILIINAAECEPYITADDMLMREHAEELILGIEILEHILKPKLVIIGIEDNKPDAIAALESAAINKNNIVIRAIPTKYPSGGEKQLIKVLTNKEVPKGGIPADIGMLVQNVGTLYAIKRAVVNHEPMIERIVTLTGGAFRQPRNVWVRLGTPVQALLGEFNYHIQKKHPRLIMGGPMMGFTLPTPEVPVTKTSNCILAPTKAELPPASAEMACIRCGQCAEACPVSLLPQQMFWYSKDKDYEKCEELNISDCVECGSCAYVCPSNIPLVHYYRRSKAEIRTAKEEAAAAERAKQRFEDKKARLAREKAERENKFKKAADDRRSSMAKSGDDDAIAAAIARVKAQKAEVKPETEGPKPAVAAAIARAKAKQAEAAKSGNDEPDNSEMSKLREERKRQARERKAAKVESSENQTTETASSDDKKAAVAAAIARAKAKKQTQAEDKPVVPVSEADSADTPADSKKAAVAAAIARAKAKKQAQVEEKPAEPAPETGNAESPEDKKKAAVAAAIARAKAKKQTQVEEKPAEPAPETGNAESPEDKKKAAVAAAIARAKAKKQAQAEEKPAEPAPEADNAESPEDKKKAAVAAAIARAKAKKQAQVEEKPAEPAPEADNAESPEDKKKAAVAAAIARAKAKKAAQKNKQDLEENN